MFRKIRSKKDARLYFRYYDLGIELGKLKTILIKLGYIEHVEGDRFLEIKKLPANFELYHILKKMGIECPGRPDGEECWIDYEGEYESN